jgi:hypothetical protein
VVVGSGYVGLLTVKQDGYPQARAVQLVAPLLAFVAVLGWDAILKQVPSRGNSEDKHVNLFRLGVCLVTVAAIATVNVRASAAMVNPQVARARHLDGRYLAASDWVVDRGGKDGSDVTVLDPDFASQLWMALLLRDRTSVSFPVLWPDYLRQSTYWDGAVDPLLLVGPGAIWASASNAVVAENRSFVMLRTRDTNMAAAVPASLAGWTPHALRRGSQTGPDLGQILVFTGGRSREVQLALAFPGVNGRSVTASSGGKLLAAGRVVRGSVTLRLSLQPHAATDVQIDLGSDGVAGTERFYLDHLEIGATGGE